MTTRIRDKHAARRATRIAQISAAALAAIGAAVAVAGLPGMEVKDYEPAPIGPVGTDTDTPRAEEDAVVYPDPYGVAESLSYIGNAPEPEAVAIDEPVDVPPPSTNGGMTGIDVRYIGSITSGGRPAAFLNIAGVTKFLRPGEVYEGVKLVEVVGNEVAISINGGEEEMIGKAERKGSAISVVTGGAPAVERSEPNTAVAGDEPPMPPTEMSREERRQYYLDRARSDRTRWQRERGENGGPPN